MLKYDHFIFDFDGTLSDSYPAFVKAAKIIADKYNVCATADEIYYLLKKYSTVYLFETLDFGDRRNTAHNEFKVLSNEILGTEARAISGTKELLSYICENGGKCYIYSHSGEVVLKNAQKWNIDVYCTDFFLGDVKYPRKPAPDALLALMNKHGLDPRKCIMIGDRDIDVLAGKNAGMDGILIDDEHYYTDLETTYRVSDLSEIKDII